MNVRWEEERRIPPFGAPTPGRTEARGALSLRWENRRRGTGGEHQKLEFRVAGLGCRRQRWCWGESVCTAGVMAAMR